MITRRIWLNPTLKCIKYAVCTSSGSEADRISIIPSRLPTRGPWGGSCSGFDLKVIICGFCANFYFYLNYGRKIQFYLMKRTIKY
jgi:hypothetical protein